MNLINRKALGTLCLVIATFLNPFGFDILVYKVTQLTNDYWNTMYMLYVSALLLFGFSYLSFKFGKKGLGNFLLASAMFLNPFGYDIIVYGITCLTNNYWLTMSIMYLMTGVFFGFFMYLYDINVITAFKDKHNKLKIKINKNG